MTAPPAPSSDALNEAIRLFNHEKTLDAYRLLKQHKVESVSELNVDEQSKKDLHQILEDGKFAEFLLNEFESGNGWHQCVNKDKMQSFYKDKGSGLHAVKVQGSIEAPIFQVLSIFYEGMYQCEFLKFMKITVDLYASWVPSMKESTVIHKFDKYRFLSYFSFSLPWPFSPRDLVSYAFAIDQLESDGSIIIVVKGVTSESQYKDIIVPYEKTGSVFAGCEYSGVRIKYISPGKIVIH